MFRTLIISGMMVGVMATLAVAQAAEVTTLDAQRVSGTLKDISDKGVVLVDAKNKSRRLPLTQLSEVTFGQSKALLQTAGQVVVETFGGAVLPATKLTIADDKVRFVSSVGQADGVGVALNRVKLILFPAAEQTPGEILAQCAKRDYTTSAEDLVVVESKGKIVSVSGVLKAVNNKNISFQYRGKIREIGREKVRAIWLSKTIEIKKSARGKAILRDGGELAFSSIHMNKAEIGIQQPDGLALTIPLSKLAAFRFTSDRVVMLSTLKPTVVKEQGMLDIKFPHRANCAVSGKPLRLCGKEYRSGMGLHSFCELTFNIAGKYSAFLAAAGIDDAVRPAGDATLTILGDGKVLAGPIRLTGKDKGPTPLRVKLRGVKKLTFRVEVGKDKLNVADHVDLVNARLIK